MKRLIHTNSIICFVLIAAFGMVSCENNTTSPADPISTDNYPTLTFDTDYEGSTVAEGDTIMYQVTADRPFENPVSIELSVSGENIEDHDVENTVVEFPAFEADITIEFPVVFPMDDIPENESKELTYTINDQDIGTQYTINPNTEFPEKTVTLENYNDPSGLTVALNWENPADDLDLFGLLYQGGEYAGTNVIAATAAKPETLVEDTGMEGEWYYTIDPFAVEQAEVSYTLSVGYPNQDVEIFEGSFNAETPELTPDLAGYRVLQVTSTENASGDIEFTVENLNP